MDGGWWCCVCMQTVAESFFRKTITESFWKSFFRVVRDRVDCLLKYSCLFEREDVGIKLDKHNLFLGWFWLSYLEFTSRKV